MKIDKIIIRHSEGSKANQNDEFNFDNNDTISLGRSSDANVQFDPESDNGVSRQHATITKGETVGQFFIEDNNSLNGVFVNGEKISSKRELFAGDTVQLGLKGPKFSFDLDPRPKIAKATELMQVYAATQEISVEDMEPEVIQESSKVGIGKETFERAIVEERKRSTFNVATMLIGGLLIAGALAFALRDKWLPKPPPPPEPHVVDIPKQFDAASIAEQNMSKLVLIETGWKLSHAQGGDDIYHEYTVIKDPQTNQDVSVPIFIEVSQGVIEPLLGLRRNVVNGQPISAAGSGTGFVIDKKGHIMTNKHVSSAWKSTPYPFSPNLQGVLLRAINGKWQNVGLINAPQNWIPGKTQMFGKEPISGTGITAEITYMDVTFAKTSQRTKATITRESSEHDLAILKIDLVGELEPVKFAKGDHEVRMGQQIMAMGFPGISPEVVKVTKDQNDQSNSYKVIPNPTLTDGRISKVIDNSRDASLSKTNDIYAFSGETYQMTINTGSGNSGGPIFNKEGEVIGVLNSMIADGYATKFTYAVPAKYALKLMGTQTVIK